jgi:hypothetical protein
MKQEKGNLRSIVCPECSKEGHVAEVAIPNEGRMLTCPACKHKFFIEKVAAKDSSSEVSREQLPPMESLAVEASDGSSSQAIPRKDVSEGEARSNSEKDTAGTVISHNSKLMMCPDCETLVSKRAKHCPHCGCPICDEIDKITSESEYISSPPPTLPADLSIGKMFSRWTKKQLGVMATVQDGESSVDQIGLGKYALCCFDNGVRIQCLSSSMSVFDIHYAQIIDVKYIDRSSLIKWEEKDKSVLGRAAVGAIVLGPIGAIVGGISGVGKKKQGFPHCAVINFWGESTDNQLKPQSIIFSAKGLSANVNCNSIADVIMENVKNWKCAC